MIRYPGDITAADFASPELIEKNVVIIREKIRSSMLKIKSLRAQNEKLTKRLVVNKKKTCGNKDDD